MCVVEFGIEPFRDFLVSCKLHFIIDRYRIILVVERIIALIDILASWEASSPTNLCVSTRYAPDCAVRR